MLARPAVPRPRPSNWLPWGQGPGGNSVSGGRSPLTGAEAAGPSAGPASVLSPHPAGRVMLAAFRVVLSTAFKVTTSPLRGGDKNNKTKMTGQK